MNIHKRVELIPANGLQSIYPVRSKKKLDVSAFNNKGQQGNFICPDMFEALKKLNDLVKINKGTLRVIDLYRSWETQEESRRLYDLKKKRAFVAKPGESFHNAGRAADLDVKGLNFEGVPKDEWLQFFWELAKPLGFQPIIKIPDLGASECWHFDFPGDWSDAYEKIPYPEVAKCATLDVGGWNPQESTEKINRMFIQSQMIRLGYYEVGKVDGVFGPKTNRILEFLEMKDWDVLTVAMVLSKRDS